MSKLGFGCIMAIFILLKGNYAGIIIIRQEKRMNL